MRWTFQFPRPTGRRVHAALLSVPLLLGAAVGAQPLEGPGGAPQGRSMPPPAMRGPGSEAMPSGRWAHRMERDHWLQGIRLSESQRDGVFDIHHTAAPRERELMKALHKGHRELQELAFAVNFDGTRARALSESLARTQADLALLHVETTQKIYVLLTPEQRKVIDARRAQARARWEAGARPEGSRSGPRGPIGGPMGDPVSGPMKGE